MKSPKRLSAYTLLPLFLGCMTLSGQGIILQQWNFQDGTNLTNTTNSGRDGASWVNTTLQVTNGALRLAGDDQGNKNGTFQAPAPYTVDDSPTGIFRFEVVFSAWNLSPFMDSPSDSVRNFNVGLMVGTTDIARLSVRSNGEDADLRFHTSSGARAGSIFNLDPPAGSALGATNTDTPYRLRADIDLNLGNITYYLNDSEIGSITDLTATSITGIRLGAFPDFDTAAAFVDLDSMTLTAIPEPSTYAALLGLAALAFLAVRRRRR